MHLPPRYWPELFCWCIKFLRLAPLPRVAGARRCRFDPCRASSYPRLLSGTLVWGLTWRVRLNALPGQLFDKALPERDALVQAAVTAEIALAIQIELVAPMRLANLAALHLEKNVIRVGGPDPTYHLVIPPEDVKNEEPLEYPLPEIVGEMMGLYLGMFRTRLCRRDNSWLFPGEAGHHKTKGTLSAQIIERITKQLGIRVTPHQFRHLAASFILEKDPANYEFVRRVLGHKNLETTIRFYVGLETVDAVRKFSAMALEGVDWKPKP
jgi:integrase